MRGRSSLIVIFRIRALRDGPAVVFPRRLLVRCLLVRSLLIRRFLVRRGILAARLTIVGASVTRVPRCGARNAIARHPHRVQSFIVDLSGNSESVTDLVTANCGRSLLTSLAVDFTVIESLIL